MRRKYGRSLTSGFPFRVKPCVVFLRYVERGHPKACVSVPVPFQFRSFWFPAVVLVFVWIETANDPQQARRESAVNIWTRVRPCCQNRGSGQCEEAWATPHVGPCNRSSLIHNVSSLAGGAGGCCAPNFQSQGGSGRGCLGCVLGGQNQHRTDATWSKATQNRCHVPIETSSDLKRA
jgi:hypothetical protein